MGSLQNRLSRVFHHNLIVKHLMKPNLFLFGSLGLLTVSAMAGSVVTDLNTASPSASRDAFSSARRPMTNPTLFDLALPTTNVHPIIN